jgi:Tfp pilus assembly protein FimT
MKHAFKKYKTLRNHYLIHGHWRVASLVSTGQIAMLQPRGKIRTAGYSLMEMCLTIAIALIVLAMGIPTLTTAVCNYQLTAAANSAAWAVQSTRYQAIMHGYPYEMVLNATNNTYQISSDSAWPGSTTFVNVGAAVPISGSAVVLSAPTTFQFKSNGTVSAVTGGMNFTVTYNGLIKTITVTNYGSVKVQ